MQHLGLKQKLLTGFLAVVLVTATSCGIGLYLFSELSAIVVSMARERVPDMRRVQRIVHESQRLQTRISYLQSLSDDAERPTAIQQLHTQWRSLQSLTEAFARTQLATLTREAFTDERTRMAALLAEIDQLDQVLANRLRVTEKREQVRQKILACQEDYNRFIRPRIEQLEAELRQAMARLAQGAEPAAALRTMTQALDHHEATTALANQMNDLTALLLAALDAQESAKLNRQARTAIRLRHAIVAQAAQTSADTETFTRAWLADMAPLISGPDSMVAARRQEIRLQAIAQAHLDKHAALATQVGAKAEHLVQVAQEQIDHFAATSEIKIQLYNALLVLATVAFLTCILLIFWIYVGRGIINRLLDTSRAMLAIARGEVDTSLPPASDDEIGDMLRALERLKGYVLQEQNLAQTDGLTGLYNRRQFDETLHKEIQRARREGTPLTLMLCDIDYFKAYNDHYGHVAGDRCLQRVAATLKAHCQRASDLCARYGGEEFAVILPATGASAAQQMGERLRQAIEVLAIPHAASPVASHVTISVGVVTLQSPRLQPALDNELLIKCADQALYAAKQSGRNQVKWCDLPDH